MLPLDPSSRLERLRRSRVRPEADTSLGPAMERVASELAKLERQLGGAGSAWARTCPATLLESTRVRSLVRGVLTVEVKGAPARFELDRALRAGLERELIKACPASLHKVKLVPA